MASSSTSPLSLGWYYIIETLADSKAELPLIKELVNRVPNFYTDAPKSAQERVALRYLEECASRGIVGTKDNTGGTIEISQSSVEVLCENLTRPTYPSEPSQSEIVPVSDHIRQFISQKRSALPKPSIALLKESVSGANAKLHSTRENGSSSSHKQEDNVVDKEQEIISSPRLAGSAEPMHNDASQNLPSQNTLDTDKTASEPLQENDPTTVMGNVSNLEAARSEPSSDDMNQFILKRRNAVPETSVEEKQCIVCNKGGQLLTCSRKDCGIIVHESCIITTPSSFEKEGRFYCPCCACSRAAHAYSRAKKVFSLARESLSSFLEMKKDQNQEKGEKGKQKVEKNITGKRKGKTALIFSDDDTLSGFSGDASSSSSWESDSRESRRRMDKNGKRKEKQVKSNDRNVSKDGDMLRGRGEEAKKCEADLAFARLDKYIHVKSGPGATSGSHEAVPMNEEMGNERRREDKIITDANRKRRRPTPRYSNKIVAPRRRNMLPWLAEEEQALREGMQKIGVTADGRIPWSTILECYRDVFHKTRFPNDLKDKWRNMMKKEG